MREDDSLMAKDLEIFIREDKVELFPVIDDEYRIIGIVSASGK